MPCMSSRVQTEAERRRREAGVEQSMKIQSLSRYVGVGGCVHEIWNSLAN